MKQQPMSQLMLEQMRVAMVILCTVGSTYAIPVRTLFNTGVDDSGAPLADNEIDLHYELIDPSHIVGEPIVATSAGGFPIGPWVGDNNDSAWIGPTEDTSGPGDFDLIPSYHYQTTFDLTGYDPSTVSITGEWSTDNRGLDILLNGASTGFENAAQFGGFSPFTLSVQDGHQFLGGVNTLEFVLNNGAAEGTPDGPTGLRVEMSGDADGLPGPYNRDIPMFTPTVDGSITADEIKGQLRIPMAWPMQGGALLLEGSGFDIDEISATWYVSWDNDNLNLSAVVRDNTPDFRIDSGGFGNVPYNAQDVIQPTFNPENDPDNFFAPDPGGGPAAIYDMVVNTADGFGPDIYRHGATLTDEGHESITIKGQETDTGYILESAIPWATAMDDVDPNYVPSLGDVHGLGLILLSFNGEDGETPAIATLFTDFGDGANTIDDPTTWNSITLVAGDDAPALQAGDADQDLDFDQLDLVKVQIAAKYLSGGAATWGEGDWNGAPGGTVGNPPAGDGLFNQRDIIAALAADTYLTGPYVAVKQGGTKGDGQTSLVYNAGTGELSVDAPAGKELTSINITSAGNKFIGDKPAALDGAFDNFAADNVFKATFGGSFGSISFSNVLPSGLSETDVAADLSAVGSLAGGGDLGEVDLVYIPEPSTLIITALATLGMLISVRCNRRRFMT